MHQLPRSPGTASPAGAARPGSAQGERFRDQEGESSGSGADGGAAPRRALDMEWRTESLAPAPRTAGPGKEALAKLSQIISVGRSGPDGRGVVRIRDTDKGSG
jgi:hypothetical protein